MDAELRVFGAGDLAPYLAVHAERDTVDVPVVAGKQFDVMVAGNKNLVVLLQPRDETRVHFVGFPHGEVDFVNALVEAFDDKRDTHMHCDRGTV